MIAFCGAVAAEQFDRRSYRADLIDLVAVVGELHARSRLSTAGSSTQIERASTLFEQLSDRQIDTLVVSLPAPRLRSVITQARRALHEAPGAGEKVTSEKTVTVANPDVTPAFCADYPAPVVLTALVTKHVAQHVIDALEFTCQESVLGSNAALGCEGPEIASALADIASDLADFCGNQQSAATNDAVLDTERSMGQHLNTQLDAVLSTRATQVAADLAFATATASDGAAADIRAQLAQDIARIDAQIVDALDDLGDLAGDISDLQSRTDDIVFRVQITQANVEDAQVRSADLQAKAAAQTVALEASRGIALALDSNVTTLAPAIQSSAREQRRDDLAAALGDANAAIAGFALPVQAGGRIEEAREVLIAAILALQTLGQGNVAQALALLAAGDQQYNAGNYAQAWRQFAAAYRALDPHVNAGNGASR